MEKTKIAFAGNYHFQNNNILVLADYMEELCITGITETGENTIALYKTAQPDIIFIDAYLSGLTGFEVARIIKEQDNAVKIIIVSENFNYDFFNLSRDLDLNGYLPKNARKALITTVLKGATAREKCFDLVVGHSFLSQEKD
jgi:DNA-binding NarL/FixJ family response regulator